MGIMNNKNCNARVKYAVSWNQRTMKIDKQEKQLKWAWVQQHISTVHVT